MKSITVDDVILAQPCSLFPRSRIEKLWANKESLTPKEISTLKIRVMDRLWALLICCLNHQQTKLFACSFFNYVLTLLEKPIPEHSKWIKQIQLYDFQTIQAKKTGELTDKQKLQVTKLRNARRRAQQFCSEDAFENSLYYRISNISYYHTEFGYSMSVYRAIQSVFYSCPKNKIRIIQKAALTLAVNHAEQEKK
jgi:hypothetical protein